MGITIGGIQVEVIGIGLDEEQTEAVTDALIEEAEERGYTVETEEEEDDQ